MKKAKKILGYLVVSVGVLVLAGCASQSPAPIIDANGAVGPTGPGGSAQTEAHGVDMGSGFNSEMMNDANNYSAEERQKLSGDIAGIMQSDGGKGNTVYFGFAQDSLSTAAKQKVEAIAKVLVEFPKQKVQVAGNTDPIGPTSYNFTLGQNRANAVYDNLLSQGVADNQICTVSYGSTRSVVDSAMMANSGCKLMAGKPTGTYSCKQAYHSDRRAVVVFGASCSGAM